MFLQIQKRVRKSRKNQFDMRKSYHNYAFYTLESTEGLSDQSKKIFADLWIPLLLSAKIHRKRTCSWIFRSLMIDYFSSQILPFTVVKSVTLGSSNPTEFDV